MITREFEQTWIEVENYRYRSKEQNVLCDFYSFLTHLKDDLNAINKYYNKEFNNISKYKIEYIIYTLNDLVKQFDEIVIDKQYIDSFCMNSFRFSQVNKEIYLQDFNYYKIKDEYYEELNEIANKVFKLEDYVSKHLQNIWENALTDINEYDKNKKYCLLAHVDYKDIDPKTIGEEFNYYSVNQLGMCCSLITDEKTRLYENANPQDYRYGKGLVGVIVKPKNNTVVAGANFDMLSTEFVNNICAFDSYFNHSKVNKCYENKKNTICCYGTRVFTPKHAFDNSVDTINEIILDNDNIEVLAVFYTEDFGGKKPERLEEYLKAQEEKAGHKLKVIEIQPRNKLKQLDLDALY